MKDTSKLPFGIYEQVLNQIISRKLRMNSEDEIMLEGIDEEEASRILTKYVSEVIENGLTKIKDNGSGIQKQIQLCNKLIKHIAENTESSFDSDLFIENQAKLLVALMKKRILLTRLIIRLV